METLTAIDTITACCYALNGRADIINELAERDFRLTAVEVDYPGLAIQKVL